MTPDEAVLSVLDALDAAAVPYMIVGSLASNFHGVPRSTRDADFVVQLSPNGLRRFRTSFASGLTESLFECKLFELSDDPHDRARFERRVSAQVLTRHSFVASAEDMVITKLRWALGAKRPKDRDDVRNILAVQGASLDRTYLDRWTAAHGTTELLADIQASVPPA